MSSSPLRLLSALLLLFLLAGCEKEVNIDLGTTATKLVVEGRIETGQPPVVFLTKSIGFTEQVNLKTLQNSFAHGAVVTLSDGVNVTTLREYGIDTGGVGVRFYVYSLDSADRNALRFLGRNEHTYFLKIAYDGNTYEAHTKIPNPAPLDSIWSVKPKGNRASTMPESRLIYARYTDPDTLGNCIRYYTQLNKGLYYPGLNAIYNDEVVNGTTFTIRIVPGAAQTNNASYDSLGIAYVHDELHIKWCSIDRPAYDFWNSYQYAQNTVGSPFASPINLRTNISNGGLGIWAGYGVTMDTLVIEE